MALKRNIPPIIDPDDNIDLESLSRHLEEDTNRKKNKTASEIEEMGEQLLKEINRKNRNKELMKNKLIPYIMNNVKGKYDLDELNSYSFEDIQDIYNQLKKENRTALTKFFHFVFNIE